MLSVRLSRVLSVMYDGPQPVYDVRVESGRIAPRQV
jgi:hypothetical protein